MSDTSSYSAEQEVLVRVLRFAAKNTPAEIETQINAAIVDNPQYILRTIKPVETYPEFKGKMVTTLFLIFDRVG